jgi:hypothetical protein
MRIFYVQRLVPLKSFVEQKIFCPYEINCSRGVISERRYNAAPRLTLIVDGILDQASSTTSFQSTAHASGSKLVDF